MKAAIRCQSLDMAGLARAEKHGKRLDWIGQQRKIRDRDPLTFGGLDLGDAYAQHIEGARQNKAAKKPVLHFLVKFPGEVLGDDAPTPYAERGREEREKLMLRQAVQFINQSHGGNAVFAARLDRDEDGETVVDVFACPRYLKESRSGRREPSPWTSATKFGEELARKHQAHIRGRFKDAETLKPITSPRAVGIALQEEFAEFFERENGVKLERKLKDSRARDRLEVEEWKLRQTQSQAREIIDTATAIGAETESRRAKFQADANSWIERNKADLAKMKREIQAEKSELRNMRERLRDLLDQAEAFLRRPDLPGLARKAGAALMKSAGREVLEETVTGHGGGSVLSSIMADTKKRATARKSAPEDPRPESSDFGGPGF